jgi:small subunit ribosomal protein S17
MCKPGDIVLIKGLPEKLTPLINHEVLKVVYPFGDVTDPITQKKVVGDMYR